MSAALVVLLVVVIGLIGAFVLTRVVARRTAAETSEQVSDADAAPEEQAQVLDGDWGVAPPSEPAEPDQAPRGD
jgi:hypothetical protein